METKKNTFATCLSCMDGRVTLPATQFIRDTHGVEFVDYITEAGMDGFISHFGPLDGILRKIDISFQKHGSAVAYVVGHADCSGNAVGDEEHRKDILTSIERLKTFRTFSAIGGLWVSRDWRVFPVTAVPIITPSAKSPTETVQATIGAPSAPTSSQKPRANPTFTTMPPSNLTKPITEAKSTSVLNCPSCGAPSEPDSNFCDQCSKPLRIGG